MKNLLKWVFVIIAVTTFSIQTADANSWSSPVMISDGGSTGWCYPQTAVDGNYVHVVWRNVGAYYTQYRRSTDNGSTWDPIKYLVYSGGGGSYNPHVAVSGQYVHIVWKGQNIAYARSTDYGANFANGVDLASHTSTWYPDVAVYGSKVYVVWWDETDNHIYLRRSTNDGASWLTEQNLGTTDFDGDLRIAAYANNVYLTWTKNPGAVADIMFMRSTDSGVTWSTPVVLWSHFGSSNDISIAAYESNVYVNQQYEGGPKQRKSTDSGASFGSSTSLGNGDLRQPEVDATAAYTSYGCTVYLRDFIYVSTGPGTEQKLTGYTSSATCMADIGANDTGDMHVVYNSEDGSGNDQIYYLHYSSPSIIIIPGDINGDKYVDFFDLAILGRNWLECNDPNDPNCTWVP